MNGAATASGGPFISIQGAVHVVARFQMIAFRDASGWLLSEGAAVALTGYRFKAVEWAAPSGAARWPSIGRALATWSAGGQVMADEEAAGWRLDDFVRFIEARGCAVDKGVVMQARGDMWHDRHGEQPFSYRADGEDASRVHGEGATGYPRLYIVEKLPPGRQGEPSLSPASFDSGRFPDDLLPVVEHVRREFWSREFDPENQKTYVKQEAILNWIAENYPDLSAARRRAVDMVACPFHRRRGER